MSSRSQSSSSGVAYMQAGSASAAGWRHQVHMVAGGLTRTVCCCLLATSFNIRPEALLLAVHLHHDHPSSGWLLSPDCATCTAAQIAAVQLLARHAHLSQAMPLACIDTIACAYTAPCSFVPTDHVFPYESNSHCVCSSSCPWRRADACMAWLEPSLHPSLHPRRLDGPLPCLTVHSC